MSQPAFITQERKPTASKKMVSFKKYNSSGLYCNHFLKKEIEFVDKLKHLLLRLLRRKTLVKSKTIKSFILCTWRSLITNFSILYSAQLLGLQLLSFLLIHFPKAHVSGILNLVVCLILYTWNLSPLSLD